MAKTWIRSKLEYAPFMWSRLHFSPSFPVENQELDSRYLYTYLMKKIFNPVWLWSVILTKSKCSPIENTIHFLYSYLFKQICSWVRRKCIWHVGNCGKWGNRSGYSLWNVKVKIHILNFPEIKVFSSTFCICLIFA